MIDGVTRIAFPHLARLTENFSSAYLQRAVASLGEKHPVIVLGDSVLWGYGIAENETAASDLRRDGVAVENFAFEGGSLPNTYAMLRLIARNRVRPRYIVFNVNQKQFNAADSAYNTLEPAVEDVSWELIPADSRALLHQTGKRTIDRDIRRRLESTWLLYGMRTDIREILFHNTDAAQALLSLERNVSGTRTKQDQLHRPTADKFEGTYDLTPLTDRNVGFRYLHLIARYVHECRIPAVAILTPTNHALLHDYIDVQAYRDNLARTRAVLRAYGISVLDLDDAMPAADFIDNDHLKSRGNAVLAAKILEKIR